MAPNRTGTCFEHEQHEQHEQSHTHRAREVVARLAVRDKQFCQKKRIAKNRGSGSGSGRARYFSQNAQFMT